MDQVFYNPRLGEDRHVQVSAAPIRDGEGNPVGAVVVARDVTELTELDRLKDQFISVAAHELKTPVAAIQGYAQALHRMATDVSPQWRRMLTAIDRGGHRIDAIVLDFLDISRLQAGQRQLIAEQVDLPALVDEVVDRRALIAPRHQLHVSIAGPVVVRADRDRLEQVLVELLDNAVRYSPAGASIDVVVARRDGEAVVSVSDHGVGIPREKQARIFKRFYRAHTGTPSDYGGMTLHLSGDRPSPRRGYVVRVARQSGEHLQLQPATGRRRFPLE